MKNIYKIIWSDEALNNLKSINNYLEKNWTEKELKQFVRLLNNRLNLIVSIPNLFPIFNQSTKVRRCVLSKQTTIYYQIADMEILLITLFDNRQNPKRLRNKLL